MAFVCFIFALAAIAGLFALLLTATPGEEKTGIILSIISCVLIFAMFIVSRLIGVN